MGQKTHPRGLRLGILETWDSKWFNSQEYAQWLNEDLNIRKFIKENLSRAGIAKVEIERIANRTTATIHTARPGVVIGRHGTESDKLQKNLENLVGKPVRVEVQEVKRPELNAQLVAETVALQLERRSNFRQAIKKNLENSKRAGAEGVKIAVGGRLGGAEMARNESAIVGRVPLHTLRANIDYGFAEAMTTYGKIGVKAWIFKGEIIGDPFEQREESERQARSGGRGRGPGGRRLGDSRSSRRGTGDFGRPDRRSDRRGGNRDR